MVLLLLGAGCSRPVDNEGFIVIDSGCDPDLLPYRFTSTNLAKSIPMPIAITDTTGINTYEVQNNWRPGECLSAVVFTLFHTVGANTLSHVNFPTDKLQSFAAHDLNGDGVDELAVSYIADDSAWLEVITPNGKNLARVFLGTGVDRNNKGFWDGNTGLGGFFDFNNDGYLDIMATVLAGYDLYPRQLMAIDWYNRKPIWIYEAPNNVANSGIRVVTKPSSDSVLIIFGSGSVANGAVLDSLDDFHAYLFCLDIRGKPVWIKEMGGEFKSTYPYIFDYLLDGTPDIITNRSYLKKSGAAADRLIVFNLDGEAQDSIVYKNQVADVAIIDLDSRSPEEIVVTLRNGEIYVYNQKLELISKYRHSNKLKILEYRDYLGTGSKQLLVLAGSMNLLFNTDFEPLAGLKNGGMAHSIGGPTRPDYRIIVGFQNMYHYYLLEPNNILKAYYYKYRQHILILLAALMAAIVTVLFYQRRTRSNLHLIARQKTELEETHEELKRTQQKLIAAEKYRQAKDIAGGVSHEIYNALCPAVHSLGRLKKTVGEPDRQDKTKDLLRLCEEAVSRAIRLTEQVTRYSRLETDSGDRSEAVSLKKLIEETMRANRLRLDNLETAVTVDVHPGLILNGHHHHIYSVFNNLFLNALDALSEVTTRHIEISAAREKDNIRIRFADTGPGIPQENLNRIFDLFYSTKPTSGTGIGLALVRKISDIYGAKINVSSILDKGTEFVILWPEYH